MEAKQVYVYYVDNGFEGSIFDIEEIFNEKKFTPEEFLEVVQEAVDRAPKFKEVDYDNIYPMDVHLEIEKWDITRLMWHVICYLEKHYGFKRRTKTLCMRIPAEGDIRLRTKNEHDANY